MPVLLAAKRPSTIDQATPAALRDVRSMAEAQGRGAMRAVHRPRFRSVDALGDRGMTVEHFGRTYYALLCARLHHDDEAVATILAPLAVSDEAIQLICTGLDSHIGMLRRVTPDLSDETRAESLSQFLVSKADE